MGDYAAIIAQKLSDIYSSQTVFATAVTALSHENVEHVILHYVNYGYQKRGVPFGLLPILRELRRRHGGRWLTIFHELYASGQPWKSAFWLRPLQMHIAKAIAEISDVAIVSSETMRAQLISLAPTAPAVAAVCDRRDQPEAATPRRSQSSATGQHLQVYPVFSNFGEPSLSPAQIANRSPHRWAICGGSILVERSLRSFRAIKNQIPEILAPQELFVLGGEDNSISRALLAELQNIRTEYRPRVAAAEASQILSTCAFMWLDYFHRKPVPMDIVLKSGAFAAACAHGVIPIFPHAGTAISLESDRLPGPFFIDEITELPALNDRPEIASAFYNWYQRHAASDHLVRGIVNTLGLIAIR